MDDAILSLADVLRSIFSQSSNAWLYLPERGDWTLSSCCAVLESDEVSPEHENDPLAGVPPLALRHELRQALPVVVVQDVVSNAQSQKQNVTAAELLQALIFYYERDAFLEFP